MSAGTYQPSFTDAELRAAYTVQRDGWVDPENPAQATLIEIYGHPAIDEDQEKLIAVIAQLARSQAEPYTVHDLHDMAERLVQVHKDWAAIGDEFLTEQYGAGLLEAFSSRIDLVGVGKDVANSRSHLFLFHDGRIYEFKAAV
jgi:hypothetical protein